MQIRLPLMVMAHLKSLQTRQQPEERYDWKLHPVKLMYKRGYGIEDVQRFFAFLDGVMDLPKGLEVQFHQELDQLEGDNQMPYITSVERLGRRIGLLQGIESMIRLRFKEEGLTLMPEIQDIHNYLFLEGVLKKAETVATLDELRQFVAEQPKD